MSAALCALPMPTAPAALFRSGFAWRRPLAALLTELRIDVFLPDDRVAADLAAINGRADTLLGQCDVLDGLRLPPSGLEVRTRCADGEHFLYVVDTACQQVVAYITLNRLVEINRRADRVLRAPHTKVATAYQRRGIASSAYRWWLDSGRSLVTGARQSPAARALWMAMARSYRLVYVVIEDKRIACLEQAPPDAVLQQLNCRAVLLGRGASLDEFVDQARHRPATPPLTRRGCRWL